MKQKGRQYRKKEPNKKIHFYSQKYLPVLPIQISNWKFLSLAREVRISRLNFHVLRFDFLLYNRAILNFFFSVLFFISKIQFNL